MYSSDPCDRCFICRQDLPPELDPRCPNCKGLVCPRHWHFVKSLCLICSSCDPLYLNVRLPVFLTMAK